MFLLFNTQVYYFLAHHLFHDAKKIMNGKTPLKILENLQQNYQTTEKVHSQISVTNTYFY